MRKGQLNVLLQRWNKSEGSFFFEKYEWWGMRIWRRTECCVLYKLKEENQNWVMLASKAEFKKLFLSFGLQIKTSLRNGKFVFNYTRIFDYDRLILRRLKLQTTNAGCIENGRVHVRLQSQLIFLAMPGGEIYILSFKINQI